MLVDTKALNVSVYFHSVALHLFRVYDCLYYVQTIYRDQHLIP